MSRLRKPNLCSDIGLAEPLLGHRIICPGERGELVATAIDSVEAEVRAAAAAAPLDQNDASAVAIVTMGQQFSVLFGAAVQGSPKPHRLGDREQSAVCK